MRVRVTVWFAACMALAAAQTLAQPQAPETLWTRILGDSTWAWDLCVTPNQDIVVLGETDSHSFPGPLALRLTAQGDTVWLRHYGPGPMMLPTAICPAGDGGFFLTGLGGSGGAEVRKIGENGDLVWRQLFVDPPALVDPYRICRSAEGGCAVFCHRPGTGPQLAILRYSETGDLLWFRTYRKSDYDYACGLYQTTDGGYMLGASTYQDTVVDRQMYLLRVDAQGDSLWSRTFGGPGGEDPKGMSPTADGGAIFAGGFSPHGTDTFWPPDAFAARVDSAGNLLWERVMGGPMWDQFFSAIETFDGNFVCAGNNRSDFPPSALWLVGLTAQGDSLWSGGYLGGAAAYNLSGMADGSLALCGVRSYANRVEGLVMRLAGANVVGPHSPVVPYTFHLAQNFPNPFNESTTLSFEVDRAVAVNLQVLDIHGRMVATLIHGQVLQGEQRIAFQPNNLASGFYFCRLLSADRKAVIKMTYLK
jgi:hypothetical protein